MISSRRLAREWALKILYQMDIGGSSLSEARDSALERLRTEFVQRGSRNASGSTAELICLEYITSSLSDNLAGLSLTFEKAVVLRLELAFSALPYWQEVRFEKAYKAKFKGNKLQPARLLLLNSGELRDVSLEVSAESSGGMTDFEADRLDEFAIDLDSKLPLLLAPEMRRTARDIVSAMYARRLNSTTVLDWAGEQMLLQERIQHNSEAIERWRKVAQIVQKQTTDWLRVGRFTVLLVNLLDERRAEIDKLLSDLSSGWKLDRQVAVDRNILRLAAMEMLFIAEIPFSASINEAVELAKKFSTAESGRFVNGVLGAIAQKIGDKIGNKQVTNDPIVAPGDDLVDDIMDSIEIIEMDDPDTIEVSDPLSEAIIDLLVAQSEESEQSV